MPWWKDPINNHSDPIIDQRDSKDSRPVGSPCTHPLSGVPEHEKCSTEALELLGNIATQDPLEVYPFMYVCTYMCTYDMYIYIYMYTFTYTYTDTDTYTYTYTYIYTYTYTCTCSYTYTYSYTYICIYIYIRIYTYTHTHIHTHI